MSRAQDIGIHALEIYFPNQCVEQTELEKFDGVGEGKYTIGLGQTRMSFCDDREDMYSLALTTVSSLLRKYNIDPKEIGRLEVGTETLLDKSKSVKSVLMQLFEPSGNTNVEGVDTVNACYGGTNALFNTVNWMESSAWDGRKAIVVAGDIALYKKGNARPTGGAGCVAMLIGPDAPIVMEPGLRGSYIIHAYDFYKPDLTSEYPVVDGHYSLRCYSKAMDNCYEAYSQREELRASQANGHANGHVNGYTNGHTNGVNGTHANGTSTPTTNGVKRRHESEERNELAPAPEKLDESPADRFDHFIFHSPTCKTVQKSYARLFYADYRRNPDSPLFANIPEEIKTLSHEDSLADKNLEKYFMTLSKKRFESRIRPGITASTMCGNMYCASVFSGLCSLISNIPSNHLQGRRIGAFSYGSGLASSMYSFKIARSTADIAEKLDLHNRLESRQIVQPEVYDEMCNLREKAHLRKNYVPEGTTDHLIKGTYYLTGIDDMFRRQYAIKE